MQVTETELRDELQPARVQYQKALRFLTQHPTDPENSIKEIVSALESVARIVFPEASTLGDALKVARKSGFLPPMLVTVLEKYYAYANAEPAIRHGAPQNSTVQRMDAEFAFHIGVAAIRYFVDRRVTPQATKPGA
jgi:hypothetical protein